MTSQRCIECLQDTPDGSPPKCEACRKRDAEYCSRRGPDVTFFRGGPSPRNTSGVHGDHDAYHGSSDPLDAQ